MQNDTEHPVPVTFTPIGVIRTPFTDPAGMPIQPAGAQEIRGSVIIGARFGEGLRDIEGFSRLILIYTFHRSPGFSLEVIPFLDTVPHGVFATRAPNRPNPIGLSVVRLIARKGNELIVEGVDVLDGTPLLDIKPYVPAFDSFPEERAGWLEDRGRRAGTRRSDDRFT